MSSYCVRTRSMTLEAKRSRSFSPAVIFGRAHHIECSAKSRIERGRQVGARVERLQAELALVVDQHAGS